MTAVAECVHHWVIPPYGSAAPGVCRNCGAQRTFSNVLDDVLDRRIQSSYVRASIKGQKALAAKRHGPAIRVAKASKPETVYSPREVRDEAYKPTRSTLVKARKQAAEKPVKAPRVKKESVQRPSRTCTRCGGLATPRRKTEIVRCRKCQRRESAERHARFCACGRQMSIRAEVCTVCAKGLSEEQKAILAYLEAHDGAYSRDLAAAIEVSPESMAHRLIKLRSRGLIEKRTSPINCAWSTYHLARDAAALSAPPGARSDAAYVDDVAAPEEDDRGSLARRWFPLNEE